MDVKQLIAKIEANRAYYVTYGNQCIAELQRKYKTQRHPDGRSLIIHNVGLDIYWNGYASDTAVAAQ